MPRASDPDVERLWRSAAFLPKSVRLLGTRYRLLFTAYAQGTLSGGEHPAAADALAFVEFMLRQDRLALLEPERRALREDGSRLRRRFRLRRGQGTIEAVEKWRILQWLNL